MHSSSRGNSVPKTSDTAKNTGNSADKNFHVGSSSGEHWMILDAGDHLRHVGTLRQCEEWLDQQENTSHAAS